MSRRAMDFTLACLPHWQGWAGGRTEKLANETGSTSSSESVGVRSKVRLLILGEANWITLFTGPIHGQS